jgi:hypothetical protein
MRNSKGQFVSVTHTILRPGNRGRKSRGLCLTRQQVRIKRKPHGTHISGKPRTI